MGHSALATLSGPRKYVATAWLCQQWCSPQNSKHPSSTLTLPSFFVPPPTTTTTSYTHKHTAAHNAAIYFAKHGYAPRHHPSALEQHISVESTVFGKTFPNPIGLGAGFDKNGEVIREMLTLGFGFVEIGTVTPLPQEGNPQPRMFRLPQDSGIINRYGFNSEGAEAVAQNLKEFRQSLLFKPKSDDSSTTTWMQSIFTFLCPPIPVTGLVGVNIGKNKTSQDAVADYVSNITLLGPYADYLVLNISSPNTAGLRDLQQSESLRPLLQACLEARDQLQQQQQQLSTSGKSSSSSSSKNNKVPLLVKLAPDLSDEELKEIAAVCVELHVDGLVVTNTTNQRPNDLVSFHRRETGGLSGAPVRDKSTECIRKLYAWTDGRIPIVGVGGVGSGRDAYDKLKAGASLVQVYSMLVYKGPGLVSRIRHELAALMLENGQRSLEDVIGLDHEMISWRTRQERLAARRAQESTVVVVSDQISDGGDDDENKATSGGK